MLQCKYLDFMNFILELSPDVYLNTTQLWKINTQYSLNTLKHYITWYIIKIHNSTFPKVNKGRVKSLLINRKLQFLILLYLWWAFHQILLQPPACLNLFIYCLIFIFTERKSSLLFYTKMKLQFEWKLSPPLILH